MHDRPHLRTALVLVLAAALATTGCATKKYVRGEADTRVDAVEARVGERIEDVESQVEANQDRLASQEEEIQELSSTAREALDRAIAAGKLAEGKLLYERILSDADVEFAFDEAELGPEARESLDAFAEELKRQDDDLFLEIQGHTDATGTEEYNLRLGEERAEAVRRYLSLEHEIPLHRMSVISYGESSPLADNGTREGRARNRRVGLVVLI